MAARIPVRVTVTPFEGEPFVQMFAGLHEITANEFIVGTEWTFTSLVRGGTFRVRNTLVEQTDTEILVDAIQIKETRQN